MKRRLICLCLCLLIAILPLAALSDAPATPNQRLYLRTGPTTAYVDIGLMPETTALAAIEYETGSGVTWVLVEYERDGQLERGYTGLKRMAVHGDIPWADHLNLDAEINRTSTVYGGPGSDYLFRSSLNAGTPVTLLRYDGDYAYIDFYEANADQPSRGWVRDVNVTVDGWDDDWEDDWYGDDGLYSGEMEQIYSVTFSNGTLVYVNNSYGALMYDAPGGGQLVCSIPAGTVLSSYSTTGNGYLLVRYGDWEGYVDKAKLTLY
jgi:hypothetical protein